MSKFPAAFAGQRFTASLYASGLPEMIIKAGTTTRASTATVADDPDLVTPSLLANATYLVEWSVRYATTLAAGWQFRWTVPSGTVSNGYTVQALGKISTTGSIDNTPSGTLFAMRQGVHGFSTITPLGSRDDVNGSVHVMTTGVVTLGATPGPVAIAWSQAVSNAALTIVGPNSWGRVTRIS